MLAIFEKIVAKCPEESRSPNCGSTTAVKDGSLVKHFRSVHSGAVTVYLASVGVLAYSFEKMNPLLPRLFVVVDNIFCLVQGHVQNFSELKQQYGMNKAANEAIIIIEAYRTLRDRGPYPSDQVVRGIQGKFAFVIYDASNKSTFLAVDADGGVPFFWGTNSEGNLILSDDIQTIQQGCFFTTSGGLRSFEHPLNDMKAVSRVDNSGDVYRADFKVDAEAKKEGGMLRVGSSNNWSATV